MLELLQCLRPGSVSTNDKVINISSWFRAESTTDVVALPNPNLYIVLTSTILRAIFPSSCYATI